MQSAAQTKKSVRELADARLQSLEAAARHWDDLASRADNPYRAETYRRTAEALRIQIRTGQAVCVCCHKPFGRGTAILERGHG